MVKPKNGPDRIAFGGRMYVAADSGAISAFQPAQHSKPKSFIKRFTDLLGRFRKEVPDEQTTQMGAPGTASPSTAQQQLWPQRYERAAYIADCRRLAIDDPRVKKATRMYCREACRGGVKIRVQGQDALSKRAQIIAADTLRRLMSPGQLEKWGWALILEGDLFIQGVLAGDRVVKLMRMPAAAMERLSDDADQIIDPERAFAQVDINTWEEVETFPEALMCQVRWSHMDGDRYGLPEIISVRRQFHKLGLEEASQTTRRLARGSISRHWDLGENAQDEDLQKFKTENGMIEGKREPFDPMEVTRDFVSKGGAKCEVLEGDPTIHEIADIKYTQDVAASGLPTPKAVYGLDAESINRDVLEDQREEWLKETQTLNDALDEVIRFAVDLALMLAGIDPALVDYSPIWSLSTTEKRKDRIESISTLRGAKLVSRRQAVAMLADYTGIEDIDAEIAEIEREDEESREEALALKAPDPLTPYPNGKSKKADKAYAAN